MGRCQNWFLFMAFFFFLNAMTCYRMRNNKMKFVHLSAIDFLPQIFLLWVGFVQSSTGNFETNN